MNIARHYVWVGYSKPTPIKSNASYVQWHSIKHAQNREKHLIFNMIRIGNIFGICKVRIVLELFSYVLESVFILQI